MGNVEGEKVKLLFVGVIFIVIFVVLKDQSMSTNKKINPVSESLMGAAFSYFAVSVPVLVF